jgi:hypothetical protein
LFALSFVSQTDNYQYGLAKFSVLQAPCPVVTWLKIPDPQILYSMIHLSAYTAMLIVASLTAVIIDLLPGVRLYASHSGLMVAVLGIV